MTNTNTNTNTITNTEPTLWQRERKAFVGALVSMTSVAGSSLLSMGSNGTITTQEIIIGITSTLAAGLISFSLILATPNVPSTLPIVTLNVAPVVTATVTPSLQSKVDATVTPIVNPPISPDITTTPKPTIIP